MFVESARRVLAEADNAVARARHAGGGGGTVRLWYTLTAAYEEAPKLVAASAAECPEITVETREAWDAELGDALAAGRVDVALGRHLPVPPGRTARTVRRDPFVAVVGGTHPVAQRATVALRDLRGETFRFFPRHRAPAYHDAVLAALHSTGERFDVWENPVPGLRNLSLRSGGFTLLPRSVALRLPPDVAVVPLRDELPTADLKLIRRPEPGTPSARIEQVAIRLAEAEGWL